MHYEDIDGKVYTDVMLRPPTEVPCHCGRMLKCTGFMKSQESPRYEYECTAGHTAGISCAFSHEHWPKAVLGRYQSQLKDDGSSPIVAVDSELKAINPKKISKTNE